MGSVKRPTVPAPINQQHYSNRFEYVERGPSTFSPREFAGATALATAGYFLFILRSDLDSFLHF
jgi:hypothetical protein